VRFSFLAVPFQLLALTSLFSSGDLLVPRLSLCFVTFLVLLRLFLVAVPHLLVDGGRVQVVHGACLVVPSVIVYILITPPATPANLILPFNHLQISLYVLIGHIHGVLLVIPRVDDLFQTCLLRQVLQILVWLNVLANVVGAFSIPEPSTTLDLSTFSGF